MMITSSTYLWSVTTSCQLVASTSMLPLTHLQRTLVTRISSDWLYLILNHHWYRSITRSPAQNVWPYHWQPEQGHQVTFHSVLGPTVFLAILSCFTRVSSTRFFRWKNDYNEAFLRGQTSERQRLRSGCGGYCGVQSIALKHDLKHRFIARF